VNDIEKLALVSGRGRERLDAAEERQQTDTCLAIVQTLLEQSSAAHEQAKFVKRLRTMSASLS
jgi:hypothetical protein